MKKFLLSSWHDVGKTLAMTVGSPSVHRRGTMLKHVAFLLLFLFAGVGNVWGISTSDLSQSAAKSITDGDTYVIANTYNGTYLMAELDGSWGKATTDITKAAIFTAHGSASGCYLTCSAGRLVPVNSNSFSAYDNGTSNNISINTTSGQIQMSSTTSRILRLNTKFRWYTTSTGSVAYLFKINSSCSNKVTLSKGTESNGTFDLDKGNGSYDNCDANFVVHVSNIVPANNAQYCNGINVTGGSSNVTGPVDGVWTVTYTKGNNITSTITPTYAAKTAASISFENAGTPAPTTSGYYVGDTYKLPSTNNYSCSGGKAFVGWSTVEVAATNTKPSSNFYEPGANVTLAASQTFYAVFATATPGEETDASSTLTVKTATEPDSPYEATDGTTWTFSGLSFVNTNSAGVAASTDATIEMALPNTASSATSITITSTGQAWAGSTKTYFTLTGSGIDGSIGSLNKDALTYTFSAADKTANKDKAGTYTLTKGGTNGAWIQSITINYKKQNVTYSAYSTDCCTSLGQINGSFFWSTLFEPLSPDKFRSHVPLCNHLFSSSHHRIPPHLIYTTYISRDFGFF